RPPISRSLPFRGRDRQSQPPPPWRGPAGYLQPRLCALQDDVSANLAALRSWPVLPALICPSVGPYWHLLRRVFAVGLSNGWRKTPNCFGGPAGPPPVAEARLGWRRLAPGAHSFRRAASPPFSRRYRSTAQPLPALVRRDRATPRHHSKSTASRPPLG